MREMRTITISKILEQIPQDFEDLESLITSNNKIISVYIYKKEKKKKIVIQYVQEGFK